eukprot:ANDGO_02608.mRNA.1 hypothetical protein
MQILQTGLVIGNMSSRALKIRNATVEVSGRFIASQDATLPAAFSTSNFSTQGNLSIVGSIYADAATFADSVLNMNGTLNVSVAHLRDLHAPRSVLFITSFQGLGSMSVSRNASFLGSLSIVGPLNVTNMRVRNFEVRDADFSVSDSISVRGLFRSRDPVVVSSSFFVRSSTIGGQLNFSLLGTRATVSDSMFVSNTTTVLGTTTVRLNSSFSGPLQIYSSGFVKTFMSVDGDVEVGGSLSCQSLLVDNAVHPRMFVTSNMTVNGCLNLTVEELQVTSELHAANFGIHGNVSVTDLRITDMSFVDGSIDVSDSLVVNGDIMMGSGLRAYCVTINSSRITGESTFSDFISNGVLIVHRNMSANVLSSAMMGINVRNGTVANDLLIASEVFIGPSERVAIRGSLLLSGDAVVSGTRVTIGGTISANNVTVPSASHIVVLSSINASRMMVQSDVVAEGSIVVDGHILLTSALFASDLVISRNLVVRSFHASGNVIALDSMVSDTVIAKAPVVISGNVTVVGSLSVGLLSTSSMQIFGSLSGSGNMSVREDVFIFGSLSVSDMLVGSVAVESVFVDILQSARDAVFGDSLLINGDVSAISGAFCKSLVVSADAVFDGDILVNGSCNVSSETFVHGLAQFKRGLSVAGSVSANELLFSSNVTILGSMNISSPPQSETSPPSAVIGAMLMVGSDLTISGSLSSYAEVRVSEDAYFSGYTRWPVGAAVTGSSFLENLIVWDDVRLHGNLIVEGNASFQGILQTSADKVVFNSPLVCLDHFNRSTEYIWVLNSGIDVGTNRFMGLNRVLGDPSATAIELRPGNCSGLWVYANGTVGLGTSSPRKDAGLHIQGDVVLGTRLGERVLLTPFCNDNASDFSCFQFAPEWPALPNVWDFSLGVTVRENGYVGMHTISPCVMLDINSNNSFIEADIILRDGGLLSLKNASGSALIFDSVEAGVPTAGQGAGLRLRFDEDYSAAGLSAIVFEQTVGSGSYSGAKILFRTRMQGNPQSSLTGIIIDSANQRVAFGAQSPLMSFDAQLAVSFETDVVFHDLLKLDGFYTRTLFYSATNEQGIPDAQGVRIRYDERFDGPLKDALLFELTVPGSSAPSHAFEMIFINSALVSTSAMRIQGDGRIGLGTATPTLGKVLDVSGDVQVRSDLYLDGCFVFNLYSSMDRVLFHVPGDSLQEDFQVRIRPASDYPGIPPSEDVLVFEKLDADGILADGLIAFTSLKGASMYTNVVLRGDGKIGINCGNPLEKLFVEGTMGMRDDLLVTEMHYSTSPDIIYDFVFDLSAGDLLSNSLFRYSGTTASYSWKNVLPSSAPFRISTDSSGAGLNAIYIHSGTRASFGTDFDTGDTLYTIGSSRFEGVLYLNGQIQFDSDVFPFVDASLGGNGFVMRYDSSGNTVVLNRVAPSGTSNDFALFQDTTTLPGVVVQRTVSSAPATIGIRVDSPSSLYVLHVSGSVLVDGETTVVGKIYTVSSSAGPVYTSPTSSIGVDMGSLFGTRINRHFVVKTGCLVPHWYAVYCCCSTCWDATIGSYCCTYGYCCEDITYYACDAQSQPRVYGNGAGSTLSSVGYYSASWTMSPSYSVLLSCNAHVTKSSTANMPLVISSSASSITVGLVNAGGQVRFDADNDPVLSFVCYGLY